MDKTKVKLRICDIDCTITSDDNEEYVRTIGDDFSLPSGINLPGHFRPF